MGEIDTKPIESVQAALTFFEHTSNDQEVEKEREADSLERELANARVQAEAMEAAHKQALLKLDHYHKTAEELSTLLKSSDLKKNFYINESRAATARIAELESVLESTARQLAQSEAARAESISQMEELSKELSEMKILREKMELEEKKSSLLAAEVEEMRREVDNLKMEVERRKEEENSAQVEMALLKSELHKGRSKLAAAEAAEARAQSEKSALYNALQQMGMEAEETKKENRTLKEAMQLAEQGTITENGEEEEEDNADKVHDHEMEDTKRELEAALSKMTELRRRAEQATSRAEAAEKARALLEEHNKKRREKKEKRKAAYAALREESMEREVDRVKAEDFAKNYQPLGKVLNMKF